MELRRAPKDSENKSVKILVLIHIALLKRRLENAFSEQQMIEFKNELNDKNLIIEQLENDIQAVKNVNKNQAIALNGMNREAPNDDYVNRYKELVATNKEEMKILAEECKIQDKRVKEQHEQVYIISQDLINSLGFEIYWILGLKTYREVKKL